MKYIIYILLTILLWPLAILILIFKLRISLTKYPKRLSFPNHVNIQYHITNWLRAVDNRIPFGSSFWFVDKPRKVGPFDPEKASKDFKKWSDEYSKKIKEL